MDFLNLLTPWAVLVAIFIPLMMAENWVHQHTFGVGYVLTKNKARATRAFYIIFFPGIFIHEFVQYLVAGLLNVPIKKGFNWPQQQENGTLRLNFVVVEHDKTDAIRAAMVAAAPLIVMMLIISEISTNILSLDDLLIASGSGDITRMWEEFRGLFGAGDFLLWFYLLFSIANSMIPKREDAAGWPLILGVLAVISAVFLVIGLDEVLVETLAGPVTHTLELVNTALFLTLLLDLIVIFILGLLEEGLARVRGVRMEYGNEIAAKTRSAAVQKREPGSDLPYPKGEPLPSIYNFLLPLPDPSDKMPMPKAIPVSEPVRPSAPSFASRSPIGSKSEGEKSAPEPEHTPLSNRATGEFTRRPSDAPTSEPYRDRPSFTRPEGERPAASTRPDFQRRPSDAPSSESQGDRPSFTRPDSERPAASTRPDFQRRPSDAPSSESQGDRPSFTRPEGERPAASTRPDFQHRPPADAPSSESQGDRPSFTRPDSERPAASTRPDFQRRPPADAPSSEPSRDRPSFTRPEGERPAASTRPDFQRRPSDAPNSESQGDRTSFTRPESERPAASTRPDFQRRPSDAPSSESQGDRTSFTRPEGERPAASARPDFQRRPSDAPNSEPSRDRPSFTRPTGEVTRRPNPEDTQKPESTERLARPSRTASTRPPERPTFQRNFKPAPRTSPFVLDEDTANELDKELEYVDFDDDVKPPSDED